MRERSRATGMSGFCRLFREVRPVHGTACPLSHWRGVMFGSSVRKGVASRLSES